MKKTFWKSWDLLTLGEQADFKNDLREYYEETYGKITNEEYFENYCIEINNDYFTDDFGDKYSNLSCSSLNEGTYEIQGVLGLWNGKKPIIPERHETLTATINRIISDRDVNSFTIGEDQWGNLLISTYHHDGQNLFTIKKVTDKGLRCINLAKNLFGCGA